MIFNTGDKVKVIYGGQAMLEFRGKTIYKKGVFSHYSKTGKYGFMNHFATKTFTQRLLKRKADEFLPL